jgi:hypothetical protein
MVTNSQAVTVSRRVVGSKFNYVGCISVSKRESSKQSCNEQSFNVMDYLVDYKLASCEEDGNTVV